MLQGAYIMYISKLLLLLSLSKLYKTYPELVAQQAADGMKNGGYAGKAGWGAIVW